MAHDLRRKTADILALRALTIEMAEQAVAWGWSMVDGERYSDGIWALTALQPPFYWSQIVDLVGQIAREQGLASPGSQDEATEWLAYGHVEDIVASGGEDFHSLKLVSRLWFDHETPSLLIFYQLKHAIREVEASGEQGHVEGLTPDNWKTMLVDICKDWLADHKRPDPFGED
ncbi:hypothetical protein [Sinisalibacter aestuarii]|uniref:Uncharacterized protein n=1 Tax=Sinisalibacter aestuarii TaxID=2949426 RepID=A0ABQ5LTP8_9RHOB|nr:hypothetical protein [Sinisalibacter aestuarii]GKY88365.1 hypothetical protein STA1M1_22340 [Sinisalibacter aestuarii]